MDSADIVYITEMATPNIKNNQAQPFLYVSYLSFSFPFNMKKLVTILHKDYKLLFLNKIS